MKHVSFVCALFFFCVSAGCLVESLTNNNFDLYTKGNEPVMVMFSTSWCGYCKKLDPEYNEAAKMLADEKSSIKLAKVSCEGEEKLCQKLNIKGYPTVLIYQNGQSMPYSGERKAEKIVSYLKKLKEPLMKELTPGKEEEEFFKSGQEIVIVGTFSDKNVPEYKVFEDYIKENRLVGSFGVVFKDGITSITLYRKDDDEKTVLKDFNAAELVKFVLVNRIPYVAEIGPENYEHYARSEVPLGFLFYSTPEEKKLSNGLKELLKPLKGKLNFVTIDATKFGQHADVLNVPRKWPVVVIHDLQKNYKYPLLEVNKETLATFITSFTEGKIKPTFKSQEEPKKEEGDVKTIVRKNINQIVMDESKDVLVSFQAPWCMHCNQMKPIYEQLAKRYSPYKDKIVISKIDMTENDIEDLISFQITGFPTVLLFKAGKNKEPVEFKAERKLKAFTDFIQENATNKVSVDVKPKEDL